MGLTLLGVPIILAVYRILVIILITKPITNNNYEYSKEVKLVGKNLIPVQHGGQVIIPTAHCSDGPLFRQPIAPTAHFSDNPLFRQKWSKVV